MKRLTLIEPKRKGLIDLMKHIQQRCDKDRKTFKFIYGRSNGALNKFWFEKYDGKTFGGKVVNFNFANNYSKFDTSECPVEVYDDMLNNGRPKLFKSKDNITFRYRQTRIRTVGATDKLEFSGRFYRQADGNDNAQAV